MKFDLIATSQGYWPQENLSTVNFIQEKREPKEKEEGKKSFLLYQTKMVPYYDLDAQ
jgi:hypothetical protein